MLNLLLFTLFIFNSTDVILDPGHGGQNLGALAFDGKTYEKNVTLDLALKIAEYVSSKGLTYKLTRRRDIFLSLKDRSDLAIKYKPRCFVSVHFNASFSHERRGIEIFYPEKGISVSSFNLLRSIQIFSEWMKKLSFSDLLTTAYINQLSKTNAFEGSVNFAKRTAWRLEAKKYTISRVSPAKFDVMSGTGTKTILFEAGFIDNKYDAKQILNPIYRKKLAADFGDVLIELCSK